MAKTKFSFSQKMEIKLPKVEGKIDTKKMKLAVNKAIVRGTQKGATYVEASLKEALNASLALTSPMGPSVPLDSHPLPSPAINCTSEQLEKLE